jgi:tyrosyl-tRNA synthetase
MSAQIPDAALIERILTRGVADVIVREEIVRLLQTGHSLRLKQGFDPSAPDIHLGHVVGLRKLRQLQNLGHTVVLIVGDWTAQIGDPSGKSATRPMLSAEDVARNAQTYLEQFFKIVDESKTEVRRQTEWFDGFDLADVIKLTRKFTVAQMLKRDDFAKRYAANRPIAITEFLYPLLQAYDSVMVRADVEFGGTDQRFNNLLGRELQQMEGQRPQQVMLVPLLVGTDGAQKMSKSLGNYIGVTDPPEEMFGKCMSIPDDLVPTYCELLTDIPDAEVAELRRGLADNNANPMDVKKRLAGDIVTTFHGMDAAATAAAHFERVVQRKEPPEDIPSLAVEDLGRVNMVRLLVEAGLVGSNAEARRLIQQGAVSIDDARISIDAIEVAIPAGAIVRAGKRRFVRLVDARTV